jgi:hypothetical protein
MPGLAARLARVSPAGPYRSVAAMLSVLLQAEQERLGVQERSMLPSADPEPQLKGMCEEEG